mmetsp:Transcript_25321/g.68801  ORF Transcript_25321/g.68801 Transcript_25321/m.68801 type:complete len:241 (+) Transcript_25321:1947-2669(+)
MPVTGDGRGCAALPPPPRPPAAAREAGAGADFEPGSSLAPLVAAAASTAGRNSSMARARMMVATSYLNWPTGANASACSSFLSNSHTCRWTLAGRSLKIWRSPVSCLRNTGGTFSSFSITANGTSRSSYMPRYLKLAFSRRSSFTRCSRASRLWTRAMSAWRAACSTPLCASARDTPSWSTMPNRGVHSSCCSPARSWMVLTALPGTCSARVAATKSEPSGPMRGAHSWCVMLQAEEGEG